MQALAQQLSPALGGIYNLVLLIAISTTALSNGAGLLKRLEGNLQWPRAVQAGLILLPAVFFVNWPLSEVVAIIYPILGYVGLIMLVAVIIKLKPLTKT